MEKPAVLSQGPVEKVVYWDVGQGDFITYFGKSRCFIFDSGGSEKIPAKDLISMRDRCPQRKAYLFISHFDKDHIYNYKRLTTYVTIEKAYFSHLEPRSKFGKDLLKTLRFQNTEIHEIRAGFVLNFDNTRLNCLWPPQGRLGKAENDRSLVFLLTNHGRKFLFTGDLPSKLEKRLPEVSASTLKAGHHGSRYSSSLAFLKSLRPTLCVVSVGKHNTYGHPSSEALGRMVEARCTILRTDKLGDITIEI